MSKVYFANLRASSENDNIPNKIGRLFHKAGLYKIYSPGDLVGIKTHFGEPGNTAFLRPQHISKIVDLVSADGAKPFVTDSNTLYVGGRSNAVDHTLTAVRHGFSYPVVNAPVVIADGLKGNDEVEVEVDLKRCKKVKIGTAAMDADAIICTTHMKGHIVTGFGGAMKNLGMGFGSRAGKLDMHSEIRPKVNDAKCRGCGYCLTHCPGNALSIINKKASVDDAKCIGCGECLVSCRYGAMDANDWSTDNSALQEKIVEYCYGIMRGREKKFGFMTFIVDVAPYCDCAPFNDISIVPDVGILASKDIVAIDQAAADLVNKQVGHRGSAISKSIASGKDKFHELSEVDWSIQLKYAEELGLGKRKYELVKV